MAHGIEVTQSDRDANVDRCGFLEKFSSELNGWLIQKSEISSPNVPFDKINRNLDRVAARRNSRKSIFWTLKSKLKSKYLLLLKRISPVVEIINFPWKSYPTLSHRDFPAHPLESFLLSATHSSHPSLFLRIETRSLTVPSYPPRRNPLSPLFSLSSSPLSTHSVSISPYFRGRPLSRERGAKAGRSGGQRLQLARETNVAGRKLAVAR